MGGDPSVERNEFCSTMIVPGGVMAIVHIPTQLRSLTAGVERVEAPGATLRQVLAALEAAYPGLSARLQKDGGISPGLAVSIDGAFTNRGLLAKVGSESEIYFLPAIGGG
jgi:sulfur-carrier protein